MIEYCLFPRPEEEDIGYMEKTVWLSKNFHSLPWPVGQTTQTRQQTEERHDRLNAYF